MSQARRKQDTSDADGSNPSQGSQGGGKHEGGDRDGDKDTKDA